MGGFAWVTLATNDSYSLGALVLAHSLRQVGTRYQLAVLVTPGVTGPMREKLSSVFDVVQEVNILDSKDEANLRLLKRPELGVTFTKLHCWRLSQYEKCVFLDADTLVLENADELFDREEFSAAPDVGWPDCFNSGVFVYRPSNDTYEKLVTFALEKGSFDGGDQGLLNLYFSDWAHKDISKHLPFIYNMCSTASYSYLPAFKQFGQNVKIVHFIGSTKPWLQYFDTESRTVQPAPGLQHLQVVLQHWWNIFFTLIQPSLTPEMTRSKSPTVHNPPSNPVFFTSRSYPPLYEHFTEPAFTSNESDYKNVWDPWEEYTEYHVDSYPSNDNQITTNPITEIQYEPFKPHNTNAHSENNNVVFQFSTPQVENKPEQTVIHEYTPEQTNTYTQQENTQPTYHQPHSDNNWHQESFVHQVHSETRPPHDETQHSHHEDLKTSQISDTRSRDSDIPSIPQFPVIQDSPRVEYFTDNSQKPAHEFEPPCAIASESTIHSADEDGDHNDAGLAGAFSQLKLGEPRSPGQLAFEDHLRRQGWEVGNIDYLGLDSFDNIWKKICQTIQAAPQTTPVEEQAAEPTASAPVEPKETTAPAPVVEPVSVQAEQATATVEPAKPQETESATPASVAAAAVAPAESETPKTPEAVSTPESPKPAVLETNIEATKSVAPLPETAPETPQSSPQTTVTTTAQPISELPTPSSEVSPKPEQTIPSPPVQEAPTLAALAAEPPKATDLVESSQPEQPKPVAPETQKPEVPTPVEPVPESPKPTVPVPESPKPEAPEPTPKSPKQEVPSPAAPVPESPPEPPKVADPKTQKIDEPTPESPKPEVPTPVALVPESPSEPPKVADPKTQKIDEPTPESPKPEVPTPVALVPESPKPEPPKVAEPETQKVETTPESPKPVTEVAAESPKAETPKPTTAPEEPACPKPTTPPAEAAACPKPAVTATKKSMKPKAEAVTGSSKPAAPESKKSAATDSPKSAAPESPKSAAPESPKPVAPESPKVKETPATPEVIAATPPTSPPVAGTPPASPPAAEAAALPVESVVPDTPPAGSGPKPPPRKTAAGPKKTKSKK